MMSVWLDAAKLDNDGPKFPNRCVVCNTLCEDRVVVHCVTSNPIVGGFGYLLSVTRAFHVPAHVSAECAGTIRRTLFFRETLPLLAMGAFSVIFLILAIVIHEGYIFGIFAALLIVGLLDFILNRKKNWPIRIHESPSDGIAGAFEFEFLNNEYAEDFCVLNVSSLVQD